MSTEYNGWRNVETWRVQLHLANYDHVARIVADLAWFETHANNHATTTTEQRLAGRLRNLVVGEIDVRLPSVGGDGFDTLLVDTTHTALERVDWDAIARHWIAAVEQSTGSTHTTVPT